MRHAPPVCSGAAAAAARAACRRINRLSSHRTYLQRRQWCPVVASARLCFQLYACTRLAAYRTSCQPRRRFDWLSDEIEGISDADDVARTLALMGEAVQDYLSVPLWMQYLE